MPSVNLGPAALVTQQSVAVVTPQNANTNPSPQGQGALRLIAVFRNLPLSGLGDQVLPILNATNWVPATTLITNSLVNGVSGSTAAATLSINSGPAVTGTSIRASAALTGQTTSAVATVAASATTNVNVSSQAIYANITVAVAGGTVDLYVYGYDVSGYTP